MVGEAFVGGWRLTLDARQAGLSAAPVVGISRIACPLVYASAHGLPGSPDGFVGVTGLAWRLMVRRRCGAILERGGTGRKLPVSLP